MRIQIVILIFDRQVFSSFYDSVKGKWLLFFAPLNVSDLDLEELEYFGELSIVCKNNGLCICILISLGNSQGR